MLSISIDLERRIGRYFALICPIWRQLRLYCLRQKCSPKVFGNRQYIISGDILRDY